MDNEKITQLLQAIESVRQELDDAQTDQEWQDAHAEYKCLCRDLEHERGY